MRARPWCALLAAGLLGCSHGSVSSTASPVDGADATVDDGVAAAFANPGAPMGTIPSAVAGISAWTFYGTSGATVAVGADASCDDSAAQVCPAVAEVAVLSDSTGHPTRIAYVSASSLGLSNGALAAGMNTDLQAAVAASAADGADGGSSSPRDYRPQGLVSDSGTSLVSTVGTLVFSCAKALVTGFAANALAAIRSDLGSTSCPANVATPCTAASGSAASGAPPTTIGNDCGTSGNVDQAAIGETTNGLLSAPFVSDISDRYNIEDPFQINSAPYAPAMTTRLSAMDALDGTTDWTPAALATFVGRMSTGNYLVFDGSLPCGDFSNPHTYLEIERAQLSGAAHQTCGGRQPNELVIDTILNFFIRGPGHTVSDPGAVSDGLTGATKPSSATFPYLPELNGVGSLL